MWTDTTVALGYLPNLHSSHEANLTTEWRYNYCEWRGDAKVACDCHATFNKCYITFIIFILQNVFGNEIAWDQ